jgi:hypothetical protein
MCLHVAHQSINIFFYFSYDDERSQVTQRFFCVYDSALEFCKTLGNRHELYGISASQDLKFSISITTPQELRGSVSTPGNEIKTERIFA